MSDPYAANVVLELRCGAPVGTAAIVDYAALNTFVVSGGLVYATAPVSGGYATGLSFDGVDDAIAVPSAADNNIVFPNYTKDITIEFRGVFPSVTGTHPILSEAVYDDFNGVYYPEWALYVKDGYLVFQLMGLDTASTRTGSLLIPAGELVTLSYSRTSDGVTVTPHFAVNGVVDTSVTGPGTVFNGGAGGAPASQVRIGAAFLQGAYDPESGYETIDVYGAYYLDTLRFAYDDARFSTVDYTPYWTDPNECGPGPIYIDNGAGFWRTRIQTLETVAQFSDDYRVPSEGGFEDGVAAAQAWIVGKTPTEVEAEGDAILALIEASGVNETLFLYGRFFIIEELVYGGTPRDAFLYGVWSAEYAAYLAEEEAPTTRAPLPVVDAFSRGYRLGFRATREGYLAGALDGAGFDPNPLFTSLPKDPFFGGSPAEIELYNQLAEAAYMMAYGPGPRP